MEFINESVVLGLMSAYLSFFLIVFKVREPLLLLMKFFK
jgi:hypothetical protein